MKMPCLAPLFQNQTSEAMKSQFTAILLPLCAAAAFGAATPPIIPQPQVMEVKDGAFQLDKKTAVAANSSALSEADKLAAMLRPATGFNLAVSDQPSSKNAIHLQLDAALQDKLGAEGYQLSVTPKGVFIRAATDAG